MEQLERRFAAIEKNNRRWKWSSIGLGLALLLVTGVAAGKPKTEMPDVIYAHKFVAVNDQGEPVVFMGHAKNVGMISVVDPDGTTLFVASSTDSGHGIVSTFDEKGHPLVTVGANHSGEGHVAVYDKGGKKVRHLVGAHLEASGAGR